MAAAGGGAVLAADGTPLKERLQKTLRRRKLVAAGLVLPLGAFVFITFMFPIVLMLFRSIDNPVINENMPLTAAILEHWDGQDIPGEEVFAALAADLAQARETKEIGRVATRMNFEYSGVRSVFTSTARKAKNMKAPFKDALIKADEKWGEREMWVTLQRMSKPYTSSQYLAALDMRYDIDNNIVMQDEDRQIYVMIFGRTLWISFLVSALCLLLGYPVAYLLATLPLKYSNLLMIMVLLPFWTSLLVRTTSWIVLLQTNGVLNDIFVWLHLIDDEGRIQMIYNQMGTVIAMTHILLPFMVLPLYSVMKTIPPSYMRAALSLGANPVTAYVRVYAPQTVPGIGAGSLLVFILSIGYYITPALVGGRTGQMISNFIAFHMQKSLNWGLAAALGGILLVGVLILYWAYSKIVGVDNMKLG
ncbi:MAG: ABC transporter permease [Rhodospirillales bacterium]|nr:ABC transporter permease [Rhodospirillales bacterium]